MFREFLRNVSSLPKLVKIQLPEIRASEFLDFLRIHINASSKNRNE